MGITELLEAKNKQKIGLFRKGYLHGMALLTESERRGMWSGGEWAHSSERPQGMGGPPVRARFQWRGVFREEAQGRRVFANVPRAPRGDSYTMECISLYYLPHAICQYILQYMCDCVCCQSGCVKIHTHTPDPYYFVSLLKHSFHNLKTFAKARKSLLPRHIFDHKIVKLKWTNWKRKI